MQTGESIGVYTMLCDGEWWCCEEDGWQLNFDGKKYRKICEVDYIGYEGAREIGVFRIEKLRNLAAYKYKFTFVSDDFMPAKALLPVIEKYL